MQQSGLQADGSLLQKDYGQRPRLYEDFRKLLDDKEVDAVGSRRQQPELAKETFDFMEVSFPLPQTLALAGVLGGLPKLITL